MATPTKKSGPQASVDARWRDQWLASVTSSSMTQRRLASVERHGGMAALREAAKAEGVHLLQLTDDKGDVLIAASRHPFKVVC